MIPWIARGLFLLSAVVLTIGFYYYAATPNAGDRALAARPAPKAEPNVVYVQTFRDTPAPDAQ